MKTSRAKRLSARSPLPSGWCCVEILGHVVLYGYVTPLSDGRLFRVDSPAAPGDETHHPRSGDSVIIGSGAIYQIRQSTKYTCMYQRLQSRARKYHPIPPDEEDEWEDGEVDWDDNPPRHPPDEDGPC